MKYNKKASTVPGADATTAKVCPSTSIGQTSAAHTQARVHSHRLVSPPSTERTTNSRRTTVSGVEKHSGRQHPNLSIHIPAHPEIFGTLPDHTLGHTSDEFGRVSLVGKLLANFLKSVQK
jgi:hypothetical protein